MITLPNTTSTRGHSQKITTNDVMLQLLRFLDTDADTIGTVFFDCDGCLSNWVKQVIKASNGKITIDESQWLDWDAHKQFISDEQLHEINMPFEFWSTMDQIPKGVKIFKELNKLSGLTVKICTAPWEGSLGFGSGRMHWLNTQLGIKHKDIIIAKDKHLLAAPNRLLIDDNPRNCVKFSEAGGNALLFPQPWNDADYSIGDMYKQLKILLDH